MNPSNKNSPKRYQFRPLKKSDLDPVAEWIRTIEPSAELAWENILQLLKQHMDLLDSPWTKSWMMEVNEQPAFAIILTRDLEPGNWLRMIAAPSIRSNETLLRRAWQAAIIEVFFQAGPGQISIEVPESITTENDCLRTLGFRLFNSVPGIFGSVNQYICSPKEFNPVF